MHQFNESILSIMSTIELMERLCTEDVDTIELGIAHLVKVSDEPPLPPDVAGPLQDIQGIIFHGDDEMRLNISVGEVSYNRPFIYFRRVHPFWYSVLTPTDPTLGCYFFHFRTPHRNIRLDDGNVDIPFKYLVARKIETTHHIDSNFCIELREKRVDILNRKLHRAAVKIQHWWLRIYFNPYNEIGQRKLKRDYEFFVKQQ